MSDQVKESKARTDAQLKASLNAVEAQREAVRQMLIKMGHKPEHV